MVRRYLWCNGWVELLVSTLSLSSILLMFIFFSFGFSSLLFECVILHFPSND